MLRSHIAILFCIIIQSCSILSLHSEETIENPSEPVQLQAACLRALHFCFNHIPESIESGFVPPQILKEEPRDDNIIEIAAFVLNLFLRELSEEDLQKVENGTYKSEDYNIIQESYLKQFLAYSAKLHTDDDLATALTLTMYLYREQFMLQIGNYIRLVFGLPLLHECAYSQQIDKLFFPIWRLRIYFLALFLKRCGVTSDTLGTVFTNEDIRAQIDRLTEEKLQQEERARCAVDAFFYFTLSHMENINIPFEYDSKTVLICCALKGDKEKAAFLCDHGASYLHKDKTGNSPLTYAERFDHPELVEFFHSLETHSEKSSSTNISHEKFKFDCIEKALQKITEYVVQEIRHKRQEALAA